MSRTFVVALALVVAVVMASRLLFAALPLRRAAMPMSVVDTVLAGVGMLGLALHCGAMFFRSSVEVLPGSGGMIDQIDALGAVSIIGYTVPAVLLLLGLRRQHRGALVVVALALAAVGITMFDGGSLQAHLSAIFVSVTILTAVAAGLVLPPWRSPAVA